MKSKLFIGVILGSLLFVVGSIFAEYTSSDQFCESCHVHPQATQSWKRSTHVDNPSGVTVHCVQCHLPPGGFAHYTEKIKFGVQDLFSKIFKDESKFNWDEKSQLEHAVKFTFKESCVECHQNIFPLTLSKKGDDAHLYYSQHEDKLRCINCHLQVGHFDKNSKGSKEFGLTSSSGKEIFTEPATVKEHENFTEMIPNSYVSFEMVAIPGGEFLMGSPESEPYRNAQEGPQRKVKVRSFWMGKVEVSWDEYEAFYSQTATEGRTDTRTLIPLNNSDVDAITGATPPYGAPDQGWGKGNRPAITMTFHAAQTYCRWLSKVTGKTYRLPTEAEWEYACRAKKDSPYFFEGDPQDFTEQGFFNSIFGADSEPIGSFAVYCLNSSGKTQLPSTVKENPFGLLNMCGNVKEFCLDWYAPSYSPGDCVNPKGPDEGEEHVVRGGSFKSDAIDLRAAARDFTRHDDWLVTDPQNPKSIWWYSDCNDVGFRVVCEYDK